MFEQKEFHMPKDRERLKPDTATKNFVERDDVFRDFLILGYPKLKVEGLMHLPERMLSERRSDVVKRGEVIKEDGKAERIFSIECQTHVDYMMPLRMVSYDIEALLWEATTNKEEKKNEGKLSKGGEFLSGKKGARVLPILSLVAYWGRKIWDGPIQFGDVTECAEDGVCAHLGSYGIKIIEVMRLKEDEIDGLESNLREVALYLQCDSDPERINEVMKANGERFERMCVEGVEVLRALANVDISDIVVNEKGEVNMKSAWDSWREKGVRDGIGIGENRKAAEVILNMHKRAMNISDIADIVAKPESEVRSIIDNKSQHAYAQA